MRLPRLRFTVRVSMLLILLVGLALGWPVVRARRQAEAVAAVQGLEGSLVFDCDVNTLGRYAPNSRPPRAPRWLQDALGPEFFRTIYTVWVRRKVPDSELTFLQGLTGLRTLHLAGTDVSDAGLSFLGSMHRLWGLDLMRCPLIGDDSARQIGGLAELKELYLSGTGVTDAGLACVRGKRGLRVIFLNDLRVTDAGLLNLEGLTNLESLALGGTRVTDAGMPHLKGLTKLNQLGLNGTRVTDAGLASLEGLAALQTLNLDDTRVTDAGLVQLEGLTGLKSLNLTGTKVTPAGVASLRSKLPGLIVIP